MPRLDFSHFSQVSKSGKACKTLTNKLNDLPGVKAYKRGKLKWLQQAKLYTYS